MDNIMDTTQILEKSRSVVDSLAEQGNNGIQEAVTLAEQQAHLCAQEWRQATKAVELTAKQEKSVQDARLAGEEKLALVLAEEADAKSAEDIVRRMVEDACRLKTDANKGTAEIMGKAEMVLGDTLRDAEAFHLQKIAQREEVEAAMSRLYATEKSVRYTMAKAQRNEGEKLLAKMIAEKQLSISIAETDVVKLRNQQEALNQQRDTRQETLKGLDRDIDTMADKIRELELACDEAENRHTQRQKSCQGDYDLVFRQLDDTMHQLSYRRETLEEKLGSAQAKVKTADADNQAATTALQELRQETEDTLAAAQAEQEKETATLEKDQAEADANREQMILAREEAAQRRLEAEAEQARLQALVDDFAEKAQEALAEEESAKEAVETTNRLAENATQIRDPFSSSFSSESSKVLSHAQEVLLEAAASAKQLMEEKGAVRLAAEKEQEKQTENLNQAIAVLEERQQELEAAHQREADAEQAWQDACEMLTKRCQEMTAHYEELKEHYAGLCKESEARNAQTQELLEKAIQARDEIEQDLSAVKEKMEGNEAERKQAQEEMAEKLAKLQDKADEELNGFRTNLTKVQQEKTTLDSQKEQLTAELSAVVGELTTLAEQILAANTTVDDLIQQGMNEISSMKEEVKKLLAAEEEARLSAGEAIAQINAAASLGDQLANNIYPENIEPLAEQEEEPESAADLVEPAESAAWESLEEQDFSIDAGCFDAIEPISTEEEAAESDIFLETEECAPQPQEAAEVDEEAVRMVEENEPKSLADYMAAIAKLEAEVGQQKREQPETEEVEPEIAQPEEVVAAESPSQCQENSASQSDDACPGQEEEIVETEEEVSSPESSAEQKEAAAETPLQAEDEVIRAIWGDQPMTAEDREYTKHLQTLSDALLENTAAIAALNASVSATAWHSNLDMGESTPAETAAAGQEEKDQADVELDIPDLLGGQEMGGQGLDTPYISDAKMETTPEPEIEEPKAEEEPPKKKRRFSFF